ncbi:MAG: hypothetical protein GKR89_21695 [Candidatus Latescibacteria bacterium]|nr:hypothetical protein [Candidatus Latescibacterota bacterium]
MRPLLVLLAAFALLSCGDSSVNSVDSGTRDGMDEAASRTVERGAEVGDGSSVDGGAPIASSDDGAPSVGEDDSSAEDLPPAHEVLVRFLIDKFEPLPERQLAASPDSSVYALYAQPTGRYRHGILGDTIEAGRLVVWRDGVVYTHTLDEQYVFEDLRPRLFDVDNDGKLEILAIRSHVARGAGITIYKIVGEALVEWAWVEEIGTPSRWLNIAAIYDLDGDGAVELAWIQTPHIGGILRLARIEPGALTVLDEASQYSNHAIGERNLCLSVVTQTGNNATLWVSTQDRERIVGFQFADQGLQQVEVLDQAVDFARPLAEQSGFVGVVQGGDGCAWP